MTPKRNFNQEQGLASMEKLAANLEREHAKLWINHDTRYWDAGPRSPAAGKC